MLKQLARCAPPASSSLIHFRAPSIGRMLGDAPPAFSEGATASAGNEEPLKAELKLETTLARLQKECTGSATATEEELKKSLQTAKDVRKEWKLNRYATLLLDRWSDMTTVYLVLGFFFQQFHAPVRPHARALRTLQGRCSTISSWGWVGFRGLE